MGDSDRSPSAWTRRTAACAVLLAAAAAGCTGRGDTGPTTTGQGLPAFESAATPPAGAGSTPAGTPTRTASTPAPPAGTVSAPVAATARSVPAGVMLRPAAWPGGRVRDSGTGVAALEQTVPSACQPKTAYPSDRHRIAARTVLIASDEPESGGVDQTVVRYAPGRAVQAMAEVRRVLAACTSYRTSLDRATTFTVRHRLVAQRFTGDDSVLVLKADRQDGTTRDWSDYITVVRIGDALVTTTSTLGEGVADPDLARRLAGTGAQQAACLRDSC